MSDDLCGRCNNQHIMKLSGEGCPNAPQRSRSLDSLIKMQGSKTKTCQPTEGILSLGRYRLRKRAELDSLEEELHGLEGQNRELRDKAESVEREIQYVKDLLIEVYKARSQRLKQDGSA